MRRLGAAALMMALTGCGVPTSDVIETGAPASGMPGPAPTRTLAEPATVPLFFLKDGEPTAYPRPATDAGDLTSVVRLLLEGPNEKERAASATTDLPRLTGAPSVTVTDGVTITVTLPDTPTPVSREALLQLTCTVRHASPPAPTAVPRPSAEEATPPAPALQLTGTSWTMTSPTSACPAKPSTEAGGL
ncbi:GerMN domain-containing protein [Streptomyces albogriseolus]